MLAVVENHQGRVPTERVMDTLPAAFRGVAPSVSWYGRQRLGSMFLAGELFCWHLHLEARVLYGPPLSRLFSGPAPYEMAARDVKSFLDTLRKSPHCISDLYSSSIYECGVIYVCVRNIAMSASWHLLSKPDFSRYSPFRLPTGLGVPMPIAEYETLMACRLAGQRGHDSPGEIANDFTLKCAMSAIEWAERVAETIGVGNVHATE